MVDKLIEYLKLIDKFTRFPQMSTTERESELIKEMLANILENNPNYGPQTKKVFKAKLDMAKNYMDLAIELQAYIATHNTML